MGREICVLFSLRDHSEGDFLSFFTLPIAFLFTGATTPLLTSNDIASNQFAAILSALKKLVPIYFL